MAGNGEEPEEEAPGTPATAEPEPRRARSAHRRAPPRRPAVERWQSSAELFGEVDGEEDPFPVERPERPKREPVFWRARDSLYFEPLVALAVIVVLLVSLFAYTSNWPPVYVVESNSMQHGAGDHLGVLNAGDVVLAEKVSNRTITTWIDGVHNGFQTYGLAGDVLLYHPNGTGSTTPIVHRALVFLTYNAPDNFSASIPAGTPCGNAPNAVYWTPNPPNNCGTSGLRELRLNGLGWHHALNLTIDFSFGSLGTHSGYLTMGDNNSHTDQYSSGGFPPISYLVMPSWVIGVARGMIPWFGALKLALDGNSALVPAASWELMGLTVAAVILAAAGIHWVLRREGIESPLRRRAERAQRAREEEVEEEEPRPRTERGGWPGLRPWREARDDPPHSPPPAPAGARGKPGAGSNGKGPPAGTKLEKFPHRLPRRRRDRPTRDDENL
jgi:signal peptidase I